MKTNRASRRRAGTFLGAAAVLLMSGAANATLIVIEPDDFASGTDISNLTPGVTLATWTQATNASNRFTPIVSAVYSTTGCGHHSVSCAPTGTSMFSANSGSQGYGWGGAFYGDGCHRLRNASGTSGYCVQGFQVFTATFDTPTSFVSFETTWQSDPVWVYAYNTAGELIMSCKGINEAVNPGCYTSTGVQLPYYSGTVSVYSALGDIAWILAGSDNGNAGIDRMTFESGVSVPEPATLGLMLTGLLGGVIGKRRRRVAAA